MRKIFIQSTIMIQLGSMAWAGYLPPQESPYWCYEACIKSDYSNHSQCVAKCTGDRIFNIDTEAQMNSSARAAACCSWGENIKGCMPGC